MLRSARNYDRNAVSLATAFHPVGPSKTVQSQKQEADINHIVRQFGLTGQLPSNIRVPLRGDFTEVGDFKEAANAIRMAQESFNSLSAVVRQRFNNDPQLFFEFCQDKENLAEMRKMGLAVPEAPPPVEPPPVRVEVINPANAGG